VQEKAALLHVNQLAQEAAKEKLRLAMDKRDLVDIARAYQSPPRYLNFFTWRGAQGHWQRTRAITLAVQMRAREQIGQFGAAVDQTLATVKQHLAG
jgi:hypothetical protein